MDLYDAIHNRRSHRRYRPEMPPRDALERVIDAALWAPSAMNIQNWEITLMAGQTRDKFVEIASRCAAALIPIMEKTGVPETSRQRVVQFFQDLGGAPVVIAVTFPNKGDYPENITDVQSASALMQNLLLAAHAEGLGTCWMTGVLLVEKELLEFLGKPEQQLLAITPIGYSAKEPPAPPRKPREVRWLGFE